MNRTLLLSACGLILTGGLLLSLAAAPANVTEVIPDAAALAGEARATAEKLAADLKDDDSFQRAVEQKSLARNGGVLACLAQALAEHGGGTDTGIAAPALRDAALAVRNAKTLDEARAGSQAVAAALAGKATDAAVEHPWNKLVGMHRMMEEMELRQGVLRRVLRRPRNLERDAKHAAVLAALGLAMEADTHEVKNEADLPVWIGMSRDYRNQMSQLAAAMKAGRAEEAQSLFNASGTLCDQCHEKFRD